MTDPVRILIGAPACVSTKFATAVAGRVHARAWVDVAQPLLERAWPDDFQAPTFRGIWIVWDAALEELSR